VKIAKVREIPQPTQKQNAALLRKHLIVDILVAGLTVARSDPL
jgi:hypothetical protein